MSFWYEKTIEDLSTDYIVGGQTPRELHIYLVTEDDLPYSDCGNIYVSVPIEDIKKFLLTNTNKE